MQILFKRDQAYNSFKLWAKIECTDEENSLIEKYKMRSRRLITAEQPSLLKDSIYLGVIAFVVFTAAIYFLRIFIGIDLFSGIIIGLALAVFIGFLYYTQRRETIYIKDLLHGRNFNCKSVVELTRKEVYLETVSSYFRQVLESAKHWDGTESRDIHPLPPEDAKRAILQGPIM